MKSTFHGTRCQNYSVFIFMASGRNFTLVNYIALPSLFITIRILWLFRIIYSLKRDDYELSILIIPCRMEADSWSTIRLRLHAKSFPSISSTTTLQASFVSWICVSILLITSRRYCGFAISSCVVVHGYELSGLASARSKQSCVNRFHISFINISKGTSNKYLILL